MAEVSIPFGPAVYVRVILDCLNGLGVRPSIVLQRTGLTWHDLHQDHQMVDLRVFHQLVKHAIQYSGEPALGLIVGSMLQPCHSPVGIAAVTSDTLGQSLQTVSRYGRLLFGPLEFRLDIAGRLSVLSVGSIGPLTETHIFVMQSIVGYYCRLLETLLGHPVDELSVGLPYPPQAGNEEPCFRYVRRATFGHECLMLQLPATLLTWRLSSANEKAFAEASQACERMESELSRGSFAQRVARILLERLALNPGAEELAGILGVSAQTLARRLSLSGLTYSEIKDELRRAHARWYLQNTDLQLKVIASQLGFENSTSFGRKFKDWYGVVPSSMRRTMRRSLE